MKFLTFSGETPAVALKQAQAECGENALVVSTKQIRKKTINSSSLYEVIVGVEEDQKKVIPPKEKYTQKSNDDMLANISEAAKQISQIAKVTNDNIGQKSNIEKEVSTKANEEITCIKDEITKLADKIKLIQEMFWEEKAPNRNNLQIPAEFAEIYKLAKKSGMGEDHLENIMNLTLEHMPSRMKSNSETIKRYFQVLLRKLIPVRVESPANRKVKKVMMFVGPTGVGKTTTIAKLAARYSYLMEKRSKVGIITLDTYRIGAVEQLFQYAKMMRLPIEDVVDPNDFNDALNSLSHCDIVLIDTVGSSQYDKQKLAKLNEFIRKSDFQIDVNLVLSAGYKLEDLEEIYKSYEFLDIDTLIFTKFDETKVFGTIFSLIYNINKPVSYFSTGQEVPDDLVTASSDFLVNCILEGFNAKKEKHDEQPGK
ncbi:MAG: flagellar biosynthesis protein FlhF [Sulfurospirillaceae bacterium]|nr:flagellar biosynthesis protein FlhF [Sulfurospirillaceae bacterium]